MILQHQLYSSTTPQLPTVTTRITSNNNTHTYRDGMIRRSLQKYVSGDCRMAWLRGAVRGVTISTSFECGLCGINNCFMKKMKTVSWCARAKQLCASLQDRSFLTMAPIRSYQIWWGVTRHTAHLKKRATQWAAVQDWCLQNIIPSMCYGITILFLPLFFLFFFFFICQVPLLKMPFIFFYYQDTGTRWINRKEFSSLS